LALALYVLNVWFDLYSPRLLFGAYCYVGGLVLVVHQGGGWRGALSFALCYGAFLALQSVSLLLSWASSAVRPLLWFYHVCIYLSGGESQALLQGPVPGGR